MKQCLFIFCLAISFSQGCRYDNLGLDDIKYKVEGEYLCEVYHDWLDWTIDSFRHDFLRYDTIILKALDGDAAISFELDGILIETQLIENTEGWYVYIQPGHKTLYIYPSDSLKYTYCAGLAPNCNNYYGTKIIE